MQPLFENGVIYMNTLEFYRTLEADDERRDVNEGAQRVKNRRGGILKRQNPENGAFEEIAQLTHSRIRELNSNLQNLNVFCSYYLNENSGESVPPIPEQSVPPILLESVPPSKGGFGVSKLHIFFLFLPPQRRPFQFDSVCIA